MARGGKSETEMVRERYEGAGADREADDEGQSGCRIERDPGSHSGRYRWASVGRRTSSVALEPYRLKWLRLGKRHTVN